MQRSEWYDGDTRNLKKQIRLVSKLVGYVAGAVFVIAPVTSFNGFWWMAGAVIVCLICIFAYQWAEPDEDPASD